MAIQPMFVVSVQFATVDNDTFVEVYGTWPNSDEAHKWVDESKLRDRDDYYGHEVCEILNPDNRTKAQS